MTLKVLFFSPHAAIWTHAFPEALIAESLQQAGHRITYVTCGGSFDRYCIAMSAYGLVPDSPSAAKAKICADCRKNAALIKEHLNLEGYDLRDRLSPADIAETERLLSQLTPSNFLELTLDGIEIGRFALYQFLLHFKKITLDFDDAEWATFRDELRNALYAFFACRTIFEQEAPDRLVVYNSLYSVNRIACELARKRGIPHFFMHGGGNLSDRTATMMFGKESTLHFLKSVAAHWPRFKERPCSADTLAYVTEHFLELFAGRSVFAYSAPKSNDVVNIRSRFGVKDHQKLLVATMSSYDERFAAETVGALPSDYSLLFPKQVDWIQALVRHVESRPDLFLLVRVHPREFPNKREGVKSEHAYLLEQVFQAMPANAAVNWPSDQISLYDLAEETDVFLNAWSSVGKEMSLLGIPTVLYSPDLVLYPPDLNYMGTDQSSYFTQIDRALSEGWSFERIRQTFRWYVLEYHRSILRIHESFNRKESLRRSLPRRIFRKARRILRPDWELVSDCRRRADTLKDQQRFARVLENNLDSVLDLAEDESTASATREQETACIRTELRRLMLALYGPDGGEKRQSQLARRLWNVTEEKESLCDALS